MNVIDFRERKPNLNEIISFFKMVFSNEQQKWQFEEERQFSNMSDNELLDFYKTKLEAKENSNLGYWLSENDITVGMIGVNRKTDTYNKHIAEIGFAVDIKNRRKGFGSRLIELAEKRAIKNGIIRLECSCLSINKPAILLLKKNNYIQEGIKIKSVYKNNQYYDRVLFGKII